MFTAQITISLAIILALILAATNLVVVLNGGKRILNAQPSSPMDYVVVLGAGVHGRELSGALKARMEIAIRLVKTGFVGAILLSGDGTETYYNETRAMQRFALLEGVEHNQIYLDPKGYSTYDSILQARNIFNIEKAYFVSQRFHLPRVLWLAESVGMEALGLPTEAIDEEAYYALREIPARSKDFLLHFLDYVPHGRREAPLR